MPLSANGRVDNRVLKRGSETEIHLFLVIELTTCSKSDILKIGVSEGLSSSLEEISDNQTFWSQGGTSLCVSCCRISILSNCLYFYRKWENFWTQTLDQNIPSPALTFPKPETFDGIGKSREERLITSIPLS
jgi:hypothetical protein